MDISAGLWKSLWAGYSREPMRVTKVSATPTCAVCERTLLQGEHLLRFSPDGGELVDVCPLCQETAVEQGWVREGAATSLSFGVPVRRKRSLISTLLGTGADDEETVVSEPILRRLSEDELALVEASDLFNACQFRRTITSVTRALGPPRASVVRLSGVSGEVVITFVWDITWYQYRVAPDAAQPVRIAERGHDPLEIEEPFRAWNASLDEAGRLVPDIARL